MLDEPAAGLDENESAELARLIRRLADERNMGVLLVEHDVEPGDVDLRPGGRHRLRSGDRHGPPAAIRDDPAVRDAYLGYADVTAEVALVTDTLIEAQGPLGGYGKMAVVRDLDLHVDAGEVVALLGANGAGKTTTLLTLAGELVTAGGRGAVARRATTPPMHARCRTGSATSPRSAR